MFMGFFVEAKGSRYKETEEPHVAPESQVADPCVRVSLFNYYWVSVFVLVVLIQLVLVQYQ